MRLFNEVKIGNHTLKNSMVMSAMTRSRANIQGVVGDLTELYYTQRASAGMILTEAINISEQALGSPFTPGIFTQEQINAWKKVTNAVHANGSLIYAQLWHTGRVAHSIDRNGILPVAPSAIAIQGGKHFTAQGPQDYEIPRALTTEEVKEIIQDYGQAALNAIEAGFDGVQLHGANGYLPHQFLAENANQRTDEYGGSIENNSRFMLEVMHTLIQAIGGERVGIKLSPFQPYGGIVLDNPVATFTYLIEELNKMDFAFVELMKRSPAFPLLPSYPDIDELEFFGPKIKAAVIANSSFTKESGEAALEKGLAKAISYGVLFLANPDLPKRFELDAPLNQADRMTMFGGGEQGYTDYPFLAQ
ncbi:MAG TPA: alkene reductase [Saprospiraceae bacterium]|nr:alkene reductase [Saprospiraceae bacterium]